MKVRRLIDLLLEYSPKAEVRTVRDHGCPLVHELDGVVSLSEIEAFEHDADLGDDEPEVVFILVGNQLGQGRAVTWEAWKANR